MAFSIRQFAARIGISGGLFACGCASVLAADLEIKGSALAQDVWSIRAIPYGWLPWLSGKQTVRGRSVDVDVHILKVIGQSDSFIGWMSAFEARKGQFAIYGDLTWADISVGASGMRSRAIGPAVGIVAGANANMRTQLATIEAGASYEVARWGAGVGSTSLEVLGGLRYWRQKADLSFAIGAGVAVGDLVLLPNGRALAASGVVDWADPVIGARLRNVVAPGHEIFLRADIGGFGVGSKFSWQAITGYSFDFAATRDVLFSGVVGYRALYVDYAKGAGVARYEFNMLQHGPLLGLIAKF